ncbi:MAG: adenine phosphoribosyltransferase [Deltaproteobacteria bacterium]|nr:adenine phosphoribosyltransferase [Deltaproteobacteria bacterium]
MDLKQYIRDVPDFPKPGIVFKDITPLLLTPKVFSHIVQTFVDRYKNSRLDKIVGIESRGFLFGAVLAERLSVGFALARKKGKLPYKTREVTYELEYGTDTIEMHVDALNPGDRVLVIDDLLATGGTALAAAQLVEKFGATVVGLSFVVQLGALGGAKRLKDYEIFSQVVYN